MENHHFFNGKIHYFYGHFQLLFVSSPEGNHQTCGSNKPSRNVGCNKPSKHVMWDLDQQRCVIRFAYTWIDALLMGKNTCDKPDPLRQTHTILTAPGSKKTSLEVKSIDIPLANTHWSPAKSPFCTGFVSPYLEGSPVKLLKHIVKKNLNDHVFHGQIPFS